MPKNGRFRKSKRSLLMWLILCAAVQSESATAQQPAVFDRYRVPVIALAGRELGNPDTFSRPSNIAHLAGSLIVIDRRADLMVHVLDAISGKTVHRFGRRGGGPGEFQGPWDILPGRTTSEFWIYDTSLRRMTPVDLDRDFPEGRFVPRRSVQLAGGTELNSLRWASSGLLLATGFVSDGLFAVYDSSGRQLPSRGAWNFGDARLSTFVRQQAYPTKIAIDASLSRIALATGYSDRVEFFEASGRRIGVAERPFGFEPVFVVTGKGANQFIASPPDMRDGYVGIRVSDSRVYALFSGRRYGDFKARASFARHVHVYSWTGRLLAVLALDADVLDIAIDADERWLYAVKHDPFPGVVAYSIPATVSRMR